MTHQHRSSTIPARKECFDLRADLSADRSYTLAPRGFNLIETAIVLAITGLIIGGIWVAAATVNANRKGSEALSGLLQIGKSFGNILSTADIVALPNQTNLNTLAINSGSVPANWVQNGSIYDPWGNQINIVSVAADVTSPVPRFAVMFSNASRAACLQLVPKLPKDDVLGVWVSAPSVLYTTTFPIAPSTVICSVVQPTLSFDFPPNKR